MLVRIYLSGVSWICNSVVPKKPLALMCPTATGIRESKSLNVGGGEPGRDAQNPVWLAGWVTAVPEKNQSPLEPSCHAGAPFSAIRLRLTSQVPEKTPGSWKYSAN